MLRIRIRMDPHDLVSWIRTRSGKKDFLYYSLARHSVVRAWIFSWIRIRIFSMRIRKHCTDVEPICTGGFLDHNTSQPNIHIQRH